MTAADFGRITVDPQQMSGQPGIRGMRMTVRSVVAAVSLYPDRTEFFKEYPELKEDDVKQALEFAAANFGDGSRVGAMELPEHIEIRPDVMMGKPCFKGTRIPVYVVQEKLKAGETTEEIMAAYPQLTKDHICVALHYDHSFNPD